MKTPAWALLVLLMCIGVPATASAQVPDTVTVSDRVWEVRLRDGSTLFGQVTEVSGDVITITTEGGVRVELIRPMIRSMVVADGSVGRRGWQRDPNLTRLFFGPTGRMLDGGEGYIGFFELFLPFLSYAITDHLTIAGGTPILPDAIGEVFYIAPKLGFRLGERASVAAGVLSFHNADPDDFIDAAGIAYGVGTYGTEDQAGTLGLGWGFAGDEVANQPVALLGFENRLSDRFKLISENYLITYKDEGGHVDEQHFIALLSVGVRIIGGRLSGDAGVGFFQDEGESFCCVPLVNFVYNFGSR